MADITKRIAGIIAAEINAKPDQALAAIGLLDEGATVPFVARYRRKSPAALTIRSCASFPNASPICANWKPVALRSWNRLAVREN
ncbi:hypothetical protein HED48_10865 [Ochrobactrum intermedium]|nr:hypothetical protein [Brucella intermedia]